MKRTASIVAFLGALALGGILTAPASLAALQESFAFDCSGAVCLGSGSAKDVFLLANGNRRFKIDRDGPVTFAVGTGTALAPPNGTLNQSASAAGVCTIADQLETEAWTYTLPANSLNANSRGVRVHAYGTTAANGNTKTVKIYFGSNAFTVIAGAVNNAIWFSTNTYLRTSASNQQRMALAGFGATLNAPTILGLTESETAAIIIKVTMQNGTAAANDICFRGVTVETIQ